MFIGKYNLGNVGFMLQSEVITPYNKYHLKEYSTHASQSPKELFNHRHPSLRNAIERILEYLRKCFQL